jgi:hypothetical protein
MFVGFERVGKTTLAKALCGAAVDAAEPSTDGLSVLEYEFPLPGSLANLQVSLWDFAGQRVYYLTHQFFLSPRATYLLVWKWSWGSEMQLDRAQLFFWLRSIAAQAPAATVFIIGTHAPFYRRRISDDEAELERAFPSLQLRFHFVESCTGIGVDELRHKLLEHTLALPETRLDVPKQWLELKQKVGEAVAAGELQAPILSLADFRTSIGTDCPQLEDALALWHDLGVLLWFREHEQLRGFVVLQPQWLADAFRCVITQHDFTSRIRAAGGHARRDAVLNAFHAVSDSARVRFLLLELLVHFEVAHRIDGELMFPYLLPESDPEPEPEHGGEPEPELEPSQRLEKVRLPFVPHGLMGRVLCGVLRLQQHMSCTQVERLSADGANIYHAPASGEVCVALRLQMEAGGIAEAPPGLICLLASGQPDRLRDELLSEVLHVIRELLTTSFRGLLASADLERSWPTDLPMSQHIGPAAAPAVAAPQWCYRDDAAEIDVALCERLETEFHAEVPRFEKQIGRRTYEFDLQRMVQRNIETDTERRLLRISTESVVDLLLQTEHDHEILLRQAAIQSAEKVKQARAGERRARKQAARARSEADRKVTQIAEQEAAKHVVAAVRAQEEADSRVAAVKAEAARQLAMKQDEARQQVEAAAAAVTDARNQAARAESEAEQKLAQLAEQEAAKRVADAARAQEEADTRVADVKAEAAWEAREAERAVVDAAAKREADASLAAGVRWACESNPYPADGTRDLEVAFHSLRLFGDEGVTATVEIRRAGVVYDVTVREDRRPMVQRRRDNGTERAVQRMVVAIGAAPVELPSCATVALQRANQQAQRDSEAAVPRLLRLVRQHGDATRTAADVRAMMAFFTNAAALHLNIDPFKEVRGQALLEMYCGDVDGRYRTMFETRTGGGSPDHEARRGWERRLFGDAYDGHDEHRPKYGNVNFLAHVKGDRAAAHYGSSYLLLRPDVRARCTITSKDSSAADARLGTLEHCAHVLLHVVEMCPARNRSDLIEVLLQLGNPAREEALATFGAQIEGLRGLQLDYTELQIHGVVQFDRDATLIVAAEQADDIDIVRPDVPRVTLAPEAQTVLWRRFTARFGVQAFRMAHGSMVPLS